MKALVFEEVEKVAVASVPEPRIEAAGDVLLKVEVAGLCGSDLHVWHGRERGLDAGTVMGHEYVGRVVERGPAVDDLRVGDLVAGSFSTSCGECFYCLNGLPARCEQGELFGWVEGGRGLHGAQAEYLRVPLAQSTLVEVPEGCDPEAALFAGDVLATGFFAAELARVGEGNIAVVLGCGPVGLCAVFGALASGAKRVFAVDAVDGRLELAQRFGAEPLRLDGDPRAAVLEATAGRGADCLLECVGSSEATRLAVDLVRPGGAVGAVGVHTEESFTFTPGQAYDKNLIYAAGRCPARRYLERLLTGLAERRWDPTPIISHRLPLAAGQDAYRAFAERREGCTKIVFRPAG
ncbi:MAG: alcohol dehydrogenase catalytic domain-containing protein [Thermoanaerobaculia bacterium]